ncbi:hypothetical protein SBV1_1490018 [Verrucomicrobia bacterium]|nr:hypothetical protein SBV1_1490018 [Verrucomicrobiota bacterium]
MGASPASFKPGFPGQLWCDGLGGSLRGGMGELRRFAAPSQSERPTFAKATAGELFEWILGKSGKQSNFRNLSKYFEVLRNSVEILSKRRSKLIEISREKGEGERGFTAAGSGRGIMGRRMRTRKCPDFGDLPGENVRGQP